MTSHQRSIVVLLDTETPGTSREIYSEDVDGPTPRPPAVFFGSYGRATTKMLPTGLVKTKYISYLCLFQHEMFTPGTNGQFYRLLNVLNKPVSFSECG